MKAFILTMLKYLKILQGKEMAKIGYKGFDVDANGSLFCLSKQYKVGEVAEQGGTLSMCNNGIHFCWDINDVHQYYNLREKVICKVEILGEVLNDTDMKKSCTNRLKVLEILTKEQVFAISNTGHDNTGIGCSGDMNSGNRNSGNRNSGNRNSGDRNSGNRNSGDMNSGNWNSGNCNSGNCNSGNWNNGDMNSGNWNSGKCNSGNCNSGNWNSGKWNSGNRNSGNRNSGDMNSGNWNSGYFNSDTPTIRLFNKNSKMTFSKFWNSDYYKAINSSPFVLTKWVEYTAEERAADKAKELIGGYLKTYDYKDACKAWWDNMTDENKAIIKTMPNFDGKIFEDITGIKV